MPDRAISTKCLTHRVSLQSSHPSFQKNFVSQKLAAILNFQHKNAYISKIMLDRVILTKILTHRVSLQSSNSNFQKKWRPFWIFEFFAKLQNTEMLISRKTVLDRVISTIFLTHRVSLQSSHLNFQNIFVSPKMAAILNFLIFRKKCKTQKCLYLENRARWSRPRRLWLPQQCKARSRAFS